MPRRQVLRRTTGVLAAAALIATAATAISSRGLPARSITGVARAASPSPPGTLLAQMRIVLPSAKAARAALRAAETQPGVPAAPSRAVPGAVRVVRPGRNLLDDLFWVRGSLLLQVGGYGPPSIPLLQSRQELVARALDAKASALR